MAYEYWEEDGYYWREDRKGNLFWLDGRRWKRFQRPTVLGAAGEAAGDTAAMAYYSALIAYGLVKKVKNSIF